MQTKYLPWNSLFDKVLNFEFRFLSHLNDAKLIFIDIKILCSVPLMLLSWFRRMTTNFWEFHLSPDVSVLWKSPRNRYCPLTISELGEFWTGKRRTQPEEMLIYGPRNSHCQHKARLVVLCSLDIVWVWVDTMCTQNEDKNNPHTGVTQNFFNPSPRGQNAVAQPSVKVSPWKRSKPFWKIRKFIWWLFIL